MKRRDHSVGDLVQDPAAAFERPRDVVDEPGLSVADKRRILEAWKTDARNLQTAAEENMQGGEPSQFDAVVAALDDLAALEKDAGAATGAPPMQLWPAGAHKVAGVYESAADALAARRHLVDAGIDEARICVLGPGDGRQLEVPSEAVAKGAVQETAKGAGVGAGVGAVGAAALAAAEMTLFVAAPAVAVLAAVGVGGLAGGTIGATASMALREPDFRAMLREALEHGCHVVVAMASSEAESLELQSRLQETVAEKTIDQGGGESA